MEFNIWAILVAAASTLVVGFIWYNPKVFGNAWMKASGLSEEQLKGGNMLKIFGLAFLFAIFISLSLYPAVIHQAGAYSMIGAEPENALPSYAAFMSDYGDTFRTFKHGAFHGIMMGLFFAFPIIGTNALFERKGVKYIFINSGFWIVCFAIMGAIICGWK